MKTLKTLASAAVLLAAVGVSAQDASHELDPAHMEDQAAQPAAADPAVPASEVASNFTDEEITAFVGAAMKIREIDPSQTPDAADRQTQAEGILAEHELDPETYNAISVAAQSDPVVAQRIQLAIGAVNENGDS
ncbi:MAG: DUF4168 domain-containing protein [Alteraurantiacibacter sp.]